MGISIYAYDSKPPDIWRGDYSKEITGTSFSYHSWSEMMDYLDKHNIEIYKYFSYRSDWCDSWYVTNEDVPKLYEIIKSFEQYINVDPNMPKVSVLYELAVLSQVFRKAAEKKGWIKTF